MARPKKESLDDDQSLVSISYKSYLEYSNHNAMAFEIAHQHLSTLMGVASREIDSIYRMQAALKAELEMTMAKNEKSKEPLAVPYPDLYKILMKEPTAPGKEAALKQLDAKFGKKKKAPKEKDPNAPKKPVTAYFSYVQDPQVKSQIDKEFPEMKSGEKQQIATQRWNAMSEEEQKPWKDKYQAQRVEYQAAQKEYLAKQGKNPDEVMQETHDEEEDLGVKNVATEPELSDESDEEEDEKPEKKVETSDEESSEESEEESPAPKKEVAKKATKATKAPSPQKKKATVDKKGKKAPEPVPSPSPEPQKKKKRKAEVEETPKPEKDKKKKKKSQGYAGNTDDY